MKIGIVKHLLRFGSRGESISLVDSFSLPEKKGCVNMKRHTVTQIRAISGSTPAETALLFNETMTELAQLDPTFERDGNTFWIYFKVEKLEAENIADENELLGKGIKCEECPLCIRDVNRFGDIDVRKKWATCGKTGNRCRIDLSACEICYRELKGVMK